MKASDRAAAAVKLGEHIAAIAVIWLAIMALGWIALMGDDIRAARLGVDSVEELDRIERSQWADHPNASKCDWECIKRIPADSEQWPQ